MLMKPHPIYVRTIVAPVLLVFSAFTGSFVQAGVQATIDAIERLPRARRLTAYPDAINRRGISADDRLTLIKAFANHARYVSPHYLKTNRVWNPKPWISILEEGFKADPNNLAIAWSLAKIYINDAAYSKATPIVESFKKARPNHHHALAWHALCTSQKDGTTLRPDRDDMLTFPLHFCVLTRNPSAHRVATLQQCRKECDILNATFRTHTGDALVHFTLKGYSSYSDIRNSGSELVRYGDSTDPYDSNRLARAFNACKNTRVRDRNAINIYIFDSYSARVKFADMTSHGKRNSNRPYVFLDWERLDNKVQNPEPHEMGHCFGLGHVGVPGATQKSPTNIMTSAGESFGSGGLRTYGFTEAQSALIQYHAKRTYQRLGLDK